MKAQMIQNDLKCVALLKSIHIGEKIIIGFSIKSEI